MIGGGGDFIPGCGPMAVGGEVGFVRILSATRG